MRLDAAYEWLAERFVDRFAAGRPERTVGREAELPLVDGRGRAGDSSRLWGSLLGTPGARAIHDVPDRDGSRLLIGVETPRWFCLAEVGRCTVEVGVGPGGSLGQLERDLGEALAAVREAASATGQRLLGYGIQPITPASARIVTPKRRYLVLTAQVPRWTRWAVTASDQLHVRLDRDRLFPAMNALNAVSGALIALCANSPIYSGRTGAASGREGLSAGVTGEPFRNGAVPRAFADAEEYIRWTAGYRFLFRAEGERFETPGTTFEEWLRAHDPSLEEYLLHEHYMWPSARPRARLGTLEIRPACQQPGASFAAAALALGLVERAPDVSSYLNEILGPRHWRSLLRYRRDAVRSGLGAREPAPGFLQAVVDLASSGLGDRGLGEGHHLDEIRERLARGAGPADQARSIHEVRGAAAVADALALG